MSDEKKEIRCGTLSDGNFSFEKFKNLSNEKKEIYGIKLR